MAIFQPWQSGQSFETLQRSVGLDRQIGVAYIIIDVFHLVAGLADLAKIMASLICLQQNFFHSLFVMKCELGNSWLRVGLVSGVLL